jgi:hypothetical protein
MSSFLNHIDNNRSEDEDDHINRLFPKCKPRASSLSLSPSLQHMSHHDSTSASSTSASDICLTSSEFPVTLPNLSIPSSRQSANFNSSNLKNAVHNLNDQSNTRRHSSVHSPSNRHYYSNELVDLQRNCWSHSGESRFDDISVEKQYEKISNKPYDNNNLVVEYRTEGLNSSSSSSSLKHSTSVGLSPSESISRKAQSSSNSTSRRKKCDNHDFQQKNHTRSLKAERKQVISERVSISQPHQLLLQRAHPNTSVDFAPLVQSPNPKHPASVITSQSSKVKANTTSCILSGQHSSDRRETEKVRPIHKDSVTKALSSSSSIVSDSLIAMECNAIDDNFDNGIGSGSSRSSGESSHSHTSDLMENLVSPTQSLRGNGGGGIPGNCIGGGNGFPATSGLTPTSIGSLRDSRIEIAGGRELYSQNRIRASRRHRGTSSYTTSSTEIIAEQGNSASISSSKMRKKSLHSHSTYQHHHCCHTTNPCCGPTSNCQEVALPTPGSLVWEPNHSCRRSVEPSSGRQQYLSHSHSLGGPSHCVKSTHGFGCCGHHGFDYSSTFPPPDFELSGNGGGSSCGRMSNSRTLPQIHGAPTSPLSIRETVFASEVRSIEKSNPGTSPIQDKSKSLNCEISSTCQNEPVIYEAVVGDGKVVFDDIGEWREGRRDVENPVECGYDGGDEHDLNESQAIRKRQMQSLAHAMGGSKGGTEDDCISSSENPRSRTAGFVANNIVHLIEGSPCASNRDGNTTPSGYESDECSASTLANNSILPPPIPSNVMNTISPHFGSKRVIGSIPIADYEGSPKRYGLKQSTHAGISHFDLGSVEMGIMDVHVVDSGHSNLLEHEARGVSLIDQTIAAATSSSSSSLDNTNTNVSSNSSSRTNNRVSPRALSPSQPLSGLTNRFPGFPQRVGPSTASSVANNDTFIHGNPGCDTSRTKGQSFEKREELSNISSTKETSFSSSSEPRFNNNKVVPTSSVGTTHALASSEPNKGPGSVNNSMRGGRDYSPAEGLVGQDGCGNGNPPPTSGSALPSNSDSQVHCSGNRNVHMKGELLESNVGDTCGAEASSLTTRSQDLLYEFSETRKVLEEFFNASGNTNGENPRADKASFDELDYTLKRQAGNSYVGQRLAGDGPGNVVSEDSPKKPPRRGVLLLGTSDGDGSDEKGSPKLISFQEISLPQMHALSPGSHQHRLSTHMQSHSLVSTNNRSPRSIKSHSRSQSQSPPPHDPTRDINDNDIDVETASTNTETDLGDTEVGMQVRGRSNFL